MVEAADPAGFDPRSSQVVLPGDAPTGVKDPAIRYRDHAWHRPAADSGF